MSLYYTLFEPCDINLFITRNCSVNADCCVPLAECYGYYSVALCENTDDKSWCCKSKGVCVTAALTGTAAGEASSIIFILPLFVSPALPLWPLVPNLTLLWEQQLWQENELGPIGLGRRTSPEMPWPLSGGVGCCQFCPSSCAPQSSSQVLGSVFHPLGRCDEWEGRLTLFFFSPQSIWGKSTSGNFTNRRPTQL